MRHLKTLAAPITALAALMAACSPPAQEAAQPVAPAATPAPAAAPLPPAAPASPDVLGLEGLGDLKIGAPPPAGGTWAERGAQQSDACRTVTSPDYPGVYAIVTDGKVQRITVGQRSDVTLAEGIGAGASEAQVAQAFPGFRSEPHKYVAAPAKYLTAPNAGLGEPALRFEIDAEGKVSLIHVGVMPVLGYVEGCS